jgi:hypothetical protein
MGDLAFLMGRKAKKPTCVHLLYNSEVIVEIEKKNFARAKELVKKLGEGSFDDLDEYGSNAFEMFELLPFSRFIEYLKSETDEIIEHPPEYWDTKEEWKWDNDA